MRPAPRPRIGLNLPLRFAEAAPAEIAAWLGEIDGEASVDTVWLLDQLAGRMNTPEPVALLGFAAAHTTRVRYGLAVLAVPGRGPVAVAKQLATADHLLGGGRLVVGVGSGDRRLFRTYGLGEYQDRPGAVLDTFLTSVRRLWTETDVSHDGPVWPFTDVTVSPRPAVPPPLWVGGGSVPALRRAARLASGWVAAGRQPTARFAELAARLDEVLAEEGRDRDTLAVGKRIYLLVEPDRARAHRVIDDWFAAFYGNADLGRAATVYGDVAACAEQLAHLAELGVTDLILHPLDESPRHEAAVLGELLPALKAH